jgi:hypothetical protein
MFGSTLENTMVRNWSLVAVSAAAAASPGRNEERDVAGTWASAPRARFSLANCESSSGHAYARGRFHDERSQKQITAYLAHRSRASDERNERALARWNDNVRQQWEIDHLSPSRRQLQR